jgi:lysophospholipase L1-like esterase
MKAIVRKRSQLILLLLFLMVPFFTAREVSRDPAGIAFIGDSITMGGAASSPAKTFTSLVTEDLDLRGAQETEHTYISLDPNSDLTVAAQAATQAPHFVIIELGVHAALAESVSPDQFRQTYASLLDCVSSGGAIVVAGTIPWLGWAPDSSAYARVEQFSRIIAEEAAKRQVAVADLWSATNLNQKVLSSPNDYAFLGSQHGDNFHPGDAGHALIAQVYAKAIDGARARPSNQPSEMVCRADGMVSAG